MVKSKRNKAPAEVLTEHYNNPSYLGQQSDIKYTQSAAPTRSKSKLINEVPLHIHHYNWSWTEPIYSYKARWSTATPAAVPCQTNKWGEGTAPEIHLSREKRLGSLSLMQMVAMARPARSLSHRVRHYHHFQRLRQPQRWWSGAAATYSQRWRD